MTTIGFSLDAYQDIFNYQPRVVDCMEFRYTGCFNFFDCLAFAMAAIIVIRFCTLFSLIYCQIRIKMMPKQLPLSVLAR